MNVNSLFGTDGIRTTVGQEPLTPTGLIKLGNAIGRWLKEKYAHTSIRILIAYDTRCSSKNIYITLRNIIASYNINVDHAGILPTPAVARLIVDQQYEAGIMITASHNLYSDNGVKIFDKFGHKITQEDELIITHSYYNRNSITKPIATPKADLTNNEYFENCYISIIKNLAQINSLSGLKIILDLAYGALSTIAPKLFKQLGAEVIILHDSPNGKNINENCGAVHPQRLQAAVIKHEAVIGFAFDGDGDRVIIANNQGSIKNGDDILAVLSTHLDYQKNNIIIGTVMTNYGLEQYLNQHKKQLQRTRVGDKYIAQALNKSASSFGGEPSGHILLPYQPITSDGLLAALVTLKTAIQTNNLSLHSFIPYPQISLSLSVQHKKDINSHPFSDIIAQHKAMLPKGRILVRYSGTESILRIMGEGKDYTLVKHVIQLLAHKISTVL